MMQAQDFTRFFSTQADTFTALARLGQESNRKAGATAPQQRPHWR